MKTPRYFYCFVGQTSTTCGTPHKITGRHDTYGDLIAFTSRAKRDKFYNEYYSSNGFASTHKTNKRDAKTKYFAGTTQREFDDHINYIDMQADENYNDYFGCGE